MAGRITVVVSQGQSNNPVKRGLEEDVVAALLFEPGIDVTVVPNLYDLKPGGTGLLALSGIGGNFILLSWLYERAAHWVLDRNGIRGKVGTVLLKASDDEEEEDDEDDEDEHDNANAADSAERASTSAEHESGDTTDGWTCTVCTFVNP